MPRNGETAPRLGETFRKKVCILLRALGYIERLDRQFGIDLVADPPSGRILFSPLFSPRGRTAFEFKSGVRVNVPNEAETLQRKIERLASAGNPEFSNVICGVVATDNKVFDAHIQRALDNQVYCWDIRYLLLLAKKVDIFKTLSRLNRDPKEKKLDDWTTFFTDFATYEGFMELEAHLFYHNPLQEMNSERVEITIQSFTNKINTMTTELNIPVIIHLRMYSIAEVTNGAEDTFQDLTSQRINQYLRYESQECFIASYKTAPWFIYCKENYLP